MKFKDRKFKLTNESKLRKFKKESYGDYVYYTHEFPALRWEGLTVLSCSIIVDQNYHVDTNVYDTLGNSYYPFYGESKAHKEILRKIESNILKEFKKLDIKEKRQKKRGYTV